MEMDIEIEEHNILENPALKSIFPDIAVLKQELEYENEDLITNPNTEFSHINTKTKNISGTKLSEDNKIYENKIITLSRKRYNSHDIRNTDLKLSKKTVVNLPDIYLALNNSKKFCKCCLILFPSISSFIIHTETISHKSMKKERESRQNTIILKKNESESRRLEKETEMKSTTMVQCSHCNSKFPSKQEVIEHLYEVLEPKINKQQSFQKNDYSMSLYTKGIENDSGLKKATINRDVDETINQNKKEELFYRCHLCSYYFKGEKFFSEHMFNKHELENYTVNKVSFSPNCIFCSLYCGDIKSYNKHLYNRHRVEILKTENIPKKHLNNTKNKTNFLGGKVEKFLQCHMCYDYYKDEKFFKQHMLYKHSINNPSMQKIAFNPKCRFCSKNYGNIKLYNRHLYKTHRKHIKQQISTIMRKNNSDCKKNTVVMPKSTLFKCCKCDMVFLSASLALNHTEHMGILINWKCEKCNLYFKRKDSAMHLLQHKSSIEFTVLEISTDLLSKLLYSCPNCAVHFQENKILDHYSICEYKTPQSAHCSVCDILIDHELYASHQSYHLKGNMNNTDFMAIDLATDGSKAKVCKYNLKNKETIKKKVNTSTVHKQNYNLYFCKTCKCFISKIHKVNIHKESRCSHFIKFPCKFCGLTLTHKGIVTHRKMHLKNKKLKLQDLTFYDLYNGRKICPPVPEHPSCKSCNIHGLYKTDIIRSHDCGEEMSKVCPFCNIILTLKAYEVHVPFHKYEIMEMPVNSRDDIEISSVTLIGRQPNVSKETHELVERSISVAYCCKACSEILDEYDKVIEHCQDHLVCNNISNTVVHKTNTNSEQYSEIYNFEPFYYGSKNDIWLKHLYGLTSKEKVNALLKNSIYKYESRVKMEISQKGTPEFTEYKCGKCNCMVDYLSVYEHINNCMKNGEKFMCNDCNLLFLKKDSLKKHLETHAQLNSPQIVIFNSKEHNNINRLIKLNACKPYVVYKCRNCEVLINKADIISHKCNQTDLKVCSDCGLSLYDTDYESHNNKHRQLASFTGNNIKVVLVGTKSLEPNETSIIKNTFIGVVCDYTFYKCSKCGVCIKNFRCTSRHLCLVDSAKAKCSKCGLYFDEGKLRGHLKLHSNDPDFVKHNIFTINFDPTGSEVSNDIKPVKHNKDIPVDESKVEEIRLAKIYKCVKCKLHFLSEDSVKEHIKKQPAKIKRQNCSKCGFAFSSNALFKHLLEHHGKKNIKYNFEVIDVTGTFKKQKIYKCKKCSLHFTNAKKRYEHFLKCQGDHSKGEKCKFCYVTFHFSYLLCHEKMHENNMHVDYEVAVTEDENYD